MIKFSSAKENAFTVITLEGRLVAGNHDDLRNCVKQMLNDGIVNIILEMSEVGSVDSSGIGFLAALHNSLKKAGGELQVRDLSKDIFEFFTALRLHTHFKISAKE